MNSNKLGATVVKRNEKLVKLLRGIQQMQLGNYQDNTIDAFSDEVRRLQLGLTLGADWQALPRLGFSLDLSMGFTGLFPADFSTVEQTLYPLYGTLGVCYEL